MKTPEEIFDEALQARGIERIGLQDAEVYEAGLDAIKQALNIPVVVGQREHFCDYCGDKKEQEFYNICEDCHLDSIQ